MTDDLRERTARALRDRRCEGECPYVYPDEFCQCARDADAVLAMLPTYEQVGWQPAKDAAWIDGLSPITRTPQHYTTDLVPVYIKKEAR